MAQITSGVRSILSHPSVYALLQTIMGADQARRDFTRDFIKPFPGMKILDIGCGPADILAYLPDHVEYWGFDISDVYIDQARTRFVARQAHFFNEQLEREHLSQLPHFDLVLASGLLHHLDDEPARDIMQLSATALGDGGKLLTIDPCFTPDQSMLSRFLVSNDRGQNVRVKAEYEALAASTFPKRSVQVRHRAWIPYTHCIMECWKSLTA